MKKAFIAAMTALSLLQAQAQTAPDRPQATSSEILSSFADPGMEYRPRVWWHWMNGNITKDGIRKDLLWMKEAGVGGVQVFDAGLDIPTVVDRRLSFMSEEWKDAFNCAAAVADSLGFEFAIAAAGGWSDTGGPWVTPDQAMKTLNWKEMDVEGGRRVDVSLPEPNRIPGKYLTHSFFGRYMPEYDYYRDIAVIAVKVPDYDRPMEELGVSIHASDGADLALLTDGDFNQVCRITPGPDGAPAKAKPSTRAWVEFSFPEAVTIRSFFYAKKDDYQPRKGLVWSCSDDGVVYREIAAVPEFIIPFMTVDIPETTARHFRLTSTIPGKDLDYTELRLYTSSKVHLDTEKAGFFVDVDIRDSYPTPEYADATAADDVIDLTPYCRDGKLSWDAPEGRWRIYRFGYTLRGRRNNPASPEATGLENDKLSAQATADYYHTYLDMYDKASGGLVGNTLSHLMIDSYEAGCQTWTADMPEEFRKRRSYDLMKWLPALAGHIIGSSEETERFLQDWRRTLGEMMVEFHYDAVDPILAEYGLKRYTEFHESGRAFPVDGMAVKKHADIPMGAIWVLPDGRAQHRYESDIRESASVAHNYGQNIVAAESFTTDGYLKDGDGHLLSWNVTPELMKGAADLALANGLNSFVIHCSVHQPVDDRLPGVSLSQYGCWFQRHETWAHEAKAWTDYLSRSSYLLRQGTFVADLAYMLSETTNVTDRFQNVGPEVPDGYAYDFVNRDIICSESFGYKALLLDPEIRFMSLEALRGIRRLADRGIIVAGAEPQTYLGLNDGEAEFKALVSDIWHSGRRNVVGFDEVGNALAAAGIEPDLVSNTYDDIRFVHRHLDDGELYFISSLRDTAVTLPLSFRVNGLRPLVLHADDATIEVPEAFTCGGPDASVFLEMAPRDAQFVLFTSAPIPDDIPLRKSARPLRTSELSLAGPWKVSFQSGRGAPDSIDMPLLQLLSENADTGVKYYSGTAVYSSSFRLGHIRKGERVVLSLGDVFNMARVRVNGVDCGLAWKKPFEVDMTKAVKRGLNSLEIEVTDSWANRLIGDQVAASEAPYTWVSPNLYSPESPLPSSGLGGPVTVKVTSF